MVLWDVRESQQYGIEEYHRTMKSVVLVARITISVVRWSAVQRFENYPMRHTVKTLSPIQQKHSAHARLNNSKVNVWSSNIEMAYFFP